MDKKDEKKEEEEKQEDVAGVVANNELDALKSLVGQLESNYKRALADYQNLVRRTDEQKSEWIVSANKELIIKLLPVLDTLMLAAKHINDKGLIITVDQFLKIFENEGVKRIKTIGEMFDPHTMEAVTTQKGEDGKVLEEIRPGFTLYDTILRSAQVIVGKKE